VTVFVPIEFIKANYHDTDSFAFDCISILETDEHKVIQFNELRKNLDSIIEVYTKIDICIPSKPPVLKMITLFIHY
jgi:hypothetical protein